MLTPQPLFVPPQQPPLFQNPSSLTPNQPPIHLPQSPSTSNFSQINSPPFQNADLTLNSFEHFLPKDTLISTKRLDQLYALTLNMRKNLETKQINDSSLNIFLSKENINLQKIEKDIAEIQNIIQTKYDLPTYQNISFIKYDTFFNGNPYEQSIEHQKRLINSNLSYQTPNLGNNSCDSLILSYLDKDDSFMKLTFQEKQFARKEKDKNSLYEMISSLNENERNDNERNNINHKSVNDKKILLPIKINEQFLYKNADDNELFDLYVYNLQDFFNYKTHTISKTTGKKSTNLNDDKIELHKTIQRFISVFKTNRKSIFELLLNQLDNKLSTFNILTSTIKYYEKDFYYKIAQGVKKHTYIEKLQLIEEYISQILYGKFSSFFNSNIKDEIILWTKIFYFIRCGLIEDCIQFISDTETFFPNLNELLLFKKCLIAINNKQNIELTDYQYLVTYLNIDDKINNPYKHACFVYMTKKNQQLNDNLLNDYNDYIWFHLHIINIYDDSYQNIIQSNRTNIKYIQLKEFQKYILSIKPNDLITSTNNIHLDYVKCLMSLMLYDSALDYLIKNIKSNYIADVTNLYFVLYNCGLCCDFNHISKQEITQINEMNQKKYSTKVQEFINVDINAVMVYIRYSDSNYIECLVNIMLQTHCYELFSNEKDNYFYINKYPYIQINDVLNINEKKSILNLISKQFDKCNSFYPEAYVSLLNKLQEYKLYEELSNVLIIDINNVIKSKTPEVLIQQRLHNKHLIQEPLCIKKTFDIDNNERLILTYYHSYIEDFNSFNNKSKNLLTRFKFMSSLEIIEEIYDIIRKPSGNEDVAYDKIVNMELIANSYGNIIEFVEREYVCFNDIMKDLYVDVCYLYFYLLKRKINKGKGYWRNNNGIYNVDEFRNRMEGLMKLVRELAKKEEIVCEKYKIIENSINEFNAKN